MEKNSKRSKVNSRIIPWHCQQRYQTSISQVSLNHTLTTAYYNRKIKSLLHNNKCLAAALENSRLELSENEKNALHNENIVNFSGIKLKDVLINLEKITACVDETVALLRSHSSVKQQKHDLGASASRKDLKQKMKALSSINMIKEIAEGMEKETNSCSKQNFKFTKNPSANIKNTAKKKKGTDAAPETLTGKNKSKKQYPKSISANEQKNISLRTCKPRADDTPPSYLLGLSSYSETFIDLAGNGETAAATKKKCTKSRKKRERKLSSGVPSTNVKAVLKEQQIHVSQKNGVSFECSNTNVVGNKTKPSAVVEKFRPSKKCKIAPFKDSTQCSENDMLSTDSGHANESFMSVASSAPKVKFKKAANHSQKIASSVDICSENTVQISPASQCDGETINVKKNITSLPTNNICKASFGAIYSDQKGTFDEDAMLRKEGTANQQTSIKQSDLSKINELSELVIPTLSTTAPALVKKVQFCFGNDEVETFSCSQKPLAKPIIRNTHKRPLKENGQNYDCLPKKLALLTAKERFDLKDKNTFIVTAEVHPPPDGYIPEKRANHEGITYLDMQPSVVLTDIRESLLKDKTVQKDELPNQIMKESTTAQVFTTVAVPEIHLEEQATLVSDAPANFYHSCNKGK